MAERAEPLPLYLITHWGVLAINDDEIIASRGIVDQEAGHLAETLVELTAHQAERLRNMINILAIVPAPVGDFLAAGGMTIHVADDGSWHRPPHLYEQ